MREKVFENKVKAYLKSKGCWVLKTWGNSIQRSGVPDLICCVNGLFVGIELKAETGKPSELQLWNISEIRKAGGVAMVLYPKDFDGFVKQMNELFKKGEKTSESLRAYKKLP